MSRPVLVLFTRVPRLGVGKRRLAAAIGDRAALRLARAVLQGVLRRLRRLRGTALVVAVTPCGARLAAPGFARIGQARGDVGMRMAAVFARYPNRRVVIIGSDIPGIGPGDIRAACRLLRGHDAVFGPAADGGYWLIGMAGKRPSDPFAGVRWSSHHALADTKRNFAARRVAMLRQLHDIDDAPPV